MIYKLQLKMFHNLQDNIPKTAQFLQKHKQNKKKSTIIETMNTPFTINYVNT